MNTHGHEQVSIDAGAPLLQEAFASLGPGEVRTTAFYLGNWITDVHQAVDPVAIAAAKGKMASAAPDFFRRFFGLVKELIAKAAPGDDPEGQEAANGKWFGATWYDKVMRTMGAAVPGTAGAVLDQAVERALSKLEEQLTAAADALFSQERVGALFTSIKDLMRVQGYWRFAHPANEPMSFDAYIDIFNTSFTQYWPHDHMDRFPAGTTAVAAGPRSPRSRPNPAGGPDLYEYLRDHIEFTAVQLARLDAEWCSQVFTSGPQSRHDADPAWNRQLAALGHALHAVEDFFAHSTFVEHAIDVCGREQLTSRPEETYTHQRRLLRFDPRMETYDSSKDPPEFDPSGPGAGPECHVATGYFDFVDTFISLGHVLDLLGVHGHWAEHGEEEERKEQEEYDEATPEGIRRRGEALLRDTLEAITNPDEALNDPENQVTQKLREVYTQLERDLRTQHKEGPSEEFLRRVVRELWPSAVPASIQDSFVAGVMVLADPRLTPLKLTYYDVLKYTELVTEGVRTMIVGLILHWTGLDRRKLLEGAEDFERRFYDLIGANRIGCHSLLAKDHGTVFWATHGFNLSRAVHWYIVYTMTRWSRPRPLRLAKAEHDASGDEQKNVVDTAEGIDWLELLEFFLAHPHNAAKGGAPTQEYGTITHKVKRTDSLAGLERQYAPTSIDPAAFSWRHIAEATWGFSEPRRINQQLKADGARLCGDGINYMFPFDRDYEVKIPNQRMSAASTPPRSGLQPWFQPIIERGDWQVIQRLAGAASRLAGDEQLDAHVWRHIPLAEQKAFGDREADLRAMLEARYQPGAAPPPPRPAPPADTTPPPAPAPDSPYTSTLEAGHTLSGTYGSGPGQYVCTTYVQEALRRSGYDADGETGAYINIRGISPGELDSLVRAGDERTKGVVTGLVVSQQGREVGLSELQPGDFVQYWYEHNGSLAGHSGQVERVHEPGVIDLHGSHGSKNGIGILSRLNLNTRVRAYAARPVGNG